LTVSKGRKFPDRPPGSVRTVGVVRVAGALALSALLLVTACRDGAAERATSIQGPAADLPLQQAPNWMNGYCHKAADDLGYAVLCPRRLPNLIDIVPCKGPAPREELWGRYCYEYVLAALFRGPPGYRGPFGGRRTGHLALWVIAPGSDFYPRGLFGCPGEGTRQQAERIAGHDGYWWACPHSATANVNSGHIAFQWTSDEIVYGLSVHGITEQNREIVRELAAQLDLVEPAS
jgi:hypothetical protein